MAHLSSCYFCGVAVDEPLQTYRVPDAEPSAEDTTITLCSTCQQKLDTVLDAAGQTELIQSDQSTDGMTTDDSREPQSSDQSTDEDVETIGEGVIDEDEMTEASDDEPADEASTEQRDTSTDDTGNSEAEDDRTENPLAESDELLEETNDLDTDGISEETLAETDLDDEMEAAGFGETPPSADDESGESDDDTETVEDETATDDSEDDTGIGSETEPDVPDEFEAASVGERGGSDDEPSDETATARSDSESAAPTPDDDTTQAPPAASNQSGQPTQESTETATGESGDDQQTPKTEASISALEYNKVMRLLQNREFPVERGEIVAIASSAYDLRENECAQVVDLAVDRGLLVEREGQLYRPDDG